MAGNTCKVSLNRSGVRELLHEIGSTVCKEKAEEICHRCGSNYATDSKRMSTRTIASVYTDNIDAILDNEQHNTLAKAVR